MGKIVTLTLHPAIDKIMSTKHFQTGSVCSCLTSHLCPAGKGLNVARALGCLHRPVLAISCIRKEEIPFFDTIQTSTVQTDWILSDNPTRTNLTILDLENGSETHIRETVSAGEFPMDEIEHRIAKHLEADDLLVISGSLPVYAPSGSLARIGKMCRGKNYLLLDSSGNQMKEALCCSPDLIKPNLEELEEISGISSLESDQNIRQACSTLADHYNIPLILVSLGPKGAILYHHPSNHALKAWTDLNQAHNLPRPATLNTVGCGDAMVAGLANEIIRLAETNRFPEKLQEKDLLELLTAGILMGTANLFNNLPGSVNPAHLPLLRKIIHYDAVPATSPHKSK